MASSTGRCSVDTSSPHTAPTALPEVLKPKRIGYPLSDAQILQILDNLPQGEKHNHWRFTIHLCAIYGLRPEDLRYLRIKDGKDGSELWATYQKSMGGNKGAKTEPRKLHPLLVRDADGYAIDWKLQARLQVGEKLPPLNSEGNGSEVLSRDLRRRAVWLSMREDAKRQGEQLTPPIHSAIASPRSCTPPISPSPTSARQWVTPSRCT